MTLVTSLPVEASVGVTVDTWPSELVVTTGVAVPVSSVDTTVVTWPSELVVTTGVAVPVSPVDRIVVT